jgi:hypothetical protein
LKIEIEEQDSLLELQQSGTRAHRSLVNERQRLGCDDSGLRARKLVWGAKPSWQTRALKRQAPLAVQFSILRGVLRNRHNAALYQRHHVATFAMAIDKSPQRGQFRWRKMAPTSPH